MYIFSQMIQSETRMNLTKTHSEGINFANVCCLIEAIVWVSRYDSMTYVHSATIARKFMDEEANCRPDNGTVIRERGWSTESKAAIIRDASVPRRAQYVRHPQVIKN